MTDAPLTFHGQTIDGETLPNLVGLAVSNSPHVDHLDHIGQGSPYLLELLRTLKETRPHLHQLTLDVLNRALFERSDATALTVLGDVAFTLSAGTFTPAGLERAFHLAQQQGVEPATLNLGRALSREFLAERLDFDPTTFRPLTSDDAVKAAFLGCFIRYDHDWFLEHARDLLTEDLQTLLGRLSWAVSTLTQGELLRLRDELKAPSHGWQTNTLQILDAYFEEIKDRPAFVDRGDAIRW